MYTSEFNVLLMCSPTTTDHHWKKICVIIICMLLLIGGVLRLAIGVLWWLDNKYQDTDTGSLHISKVEKSDNNASYHAMPYK